MPITNPVGDSIILLVVPSVRERFVESLYSNIGKRTLLRLHDIIHTSVYMYMQDIHVYARL